LRTEPPSRPVESLSGLIERVTFHNDEIGFAVLQVKAKGRRDLVAVVGSLASVSAGNACRAQA
jgi:exodeoxyribonuclease V alpha subunit